MQTLYFPGRDNLIQRAKKSPSGLPEREKIIRYLRII